MATVVTAILRCDFCAARVFNCCSSGFFFLQNVDFGKMSLVMFSLVLVGLFLCRDGWDKVLKACFALIFFTVLLQQHNRKRINNGLFTPRAFFLELEASDCLHGKPALRKDDNSKGRKPIRAMSKGTRTC